MTVTTRPRFYGKCAFVILFALCILTRTQASGNEWRLTIIPSFQHPALHKSIPGSHTATLAVAREAGYGELEFAATHEAFQEATANAEKFGNEWMTAATMDIRRDNKQVIESIFITTENSSLLPSLVMAPAFYDRLEPLLGAGFYIVIPDRNTLALYPRLAGGIPAKDTVLLLEMNRLATYPVSREVFRAQRGGLTATGILEE